MRVMQALCQKHGCSCTDLEKLLGIKRGKLQNHKITLPDSKDFSQYRINSQRDKAERAKRRNAFYRNVNCKHTVKSDKLSGKVFNFSRPLEDNIKISIPLVDKIFTLGGKYSQKISQCTVYVCEDGDESMRTKAAKECANIKVISVEQLQEMLND